MVKVIFSFALLLACFTFNANAIKCYRCKSLTDPNCAMDGINANSNIESVDCDRVTRPATLDQQMPVKKCEKVVTSDKAGVIVSRDCHFEVLGQGGNECKVSHSQHVDSCHVCAGDLCNANSAAHLFTMGTVGLLVVVSALLSM